MQAEKQLANNEYVVNSASVLMLAMGSGCSAYDCEFVSLAKSLNTVLITADKELINSFPDIAMTAKNFISSGS